MNHLQVGVLVSFLHLVLEARVGGHLLALRDTVSQQRVGGSGANGGNNSSFGLLLKKVWKC